MRKLVVMGMCALAMSLVGCSKESPSKESPSNMSPAETLLREGMAIWQEKEIQEKLEEFKSMTPEEQEKALKEAEAELESLKREEKQNVANESENAITGRSKADKYESLLRGAAKIAVEMLVKEKMEKFNSLSPEKQSREMEEMKKEIEKMKKEGEQKHKATPKRHVAMQMSGRNLFFAITGANIERSIAGLPDVWPQPDPCTDDAKDIAGKKFSSATEYFKALFDVGGDAPYVDVDQACAMSGGKSRWNVVRGVEDSMSDAVPVLISANFDCSRLPTTWTGHGVGANTPISIEPLGGNGDSAIVVIDKMGRVKVLRNDEVTLRNILGDEPIDSLPSSWLTPDGVVDLTRGTSSH